MNKEQSRRFPSSRSRFLALLFAGVMPFFVSCSTVRITNIRLADQYQRLPNPRFMAASANSKGQTIGVARYSRITVYELSPECVDEQCPIAWSIALSEEASPNSFSYGGYPGFGSQTLTPPLSLKLGRSYLLVTTAASSGDGGGQGNIRFKVTNTGAIIEE